MIHLTDVKTGRKLATLQYRRGAQELTFSPDGKTVAVTGLGEIRLWDTETGDEQGIPLADLRAGIQNIPRVLVLAFSPDGRWLVTGTDQGEIQMWDVATGESLVVFAESTEREHLEGISALVFSPDRALLAAGTRNRIHLWEVDTGDKFCLINAEHTRGGRPSNSGVVPLVFSPDGAVLVNGINIGTILLWDVTTGDQIAVLDEHTQGVSSLTFSPDGTTLVSTATDGTILLWDWDEIFKDASRDDK